MQLLRQQHFETILLQYNPLFGFIVLESGQEDIEHHTTMNKSEEFNKGSKETYYEFDENIKVT